MRGNHNEILSTGNHDFGRERKLRGMSNSVVSYQQFTYLKGVAFPCLKRWRTLVLR